MNKELFRPSFDFVALAISVRIPRDWARLNLGESFSLPYMDSENVPRFALFDRDVLHAAEQIWATERGL